MGGDNCSSCGPTNTGGEVCGCHASGVLRTQPKILDTVVLVNPGGATFWAPLAGQTIAGACHMQNDCTTPVLTSPAFSPSCTTCPLSKPFVKPKACDVMMNKRHQLLEALTAPSSSIAAPSPINGWTLSSNTCCHTLKPCCTCSMDVEVHLSETCEKRFVLFDQSGNTKRIIFHPEMVKTHPESTPLSANKITDFLDSLHDTNLKTMSLLKEMNMFEFTSSNIDSTLIGVEGLPMHHPHSEASYNARSDDNENTEEIDALLSSDNDDDEVGDAYGEADDDTCGNHGDDHMDKVCDTGHSFSAIRYPPPQSGNEGSRVTFGEVNSRKRKRLQSYVCLEEEDDADSATGTSLHHNAPSLKALLCRSEAGFKNSLPIGWGSGYGSKELFPYGLSLPHDELSSSNGGNNKQGYCTTSPKQTRKEQIRSMFQVFRGVLPGGEGMDTTKVLDEAIQFVKSLQRKLQKLQAEKAGS